MAVVEAEDLEGFGRSRLKSLLEHFGEIEDVREPWRVAHPLREVLFLVVCGTICDCEDYDLISEWGEQHLAFLRRYLPYYHGVPPLVVPALRHHFKHVTDFIVDIEKNTLKLRHVGNTVYWQSLVTLIANCLVVRFLLTL